MKIAVFVSGRGSNLKALIDAEKGGELSGGHITLVVSDKPQAPALKKAEGAGIKTFVLEAKDSFSRGDYDKGLLSKLKEEGIELVVLAGFMRILSPAFIKEYRGKILNIHPALLPSFKGVHGIKDAFNYGVKITGVTVHIVEEELDAGPVILQAAVPIEEGDTMEALEEKIHAKEHKLYPEAVRLFVGGKIKIKGRKAIIT